MRQAAGAHHQHALVLRIDFDRAAHRRTQPEQPARGRQRMLDDVDRDRHHRQRHRRVAEQRQHRQNAVIHRHLLADRRIELFLHQRTREMPGEIRIAAQIGQGALAPALVGLPVHFADAQRDRRDRHRRRSDSCGRCRRSPAGPAAVPPPSASPAGSRRTPAPMRSSRCGPLSHAAPIEGACELPMPPMMRAMFSVPPCGRWYAGRPLAC